MARYSEQLYQTKPVSISCDLSINWEDADNWSPMAMSIDNPIKSTSIHSPNFYLLF